jgi:hypothetical protein
MGRQDREDWADHDVAHPPTERLPPIMLPALPAVAIAAALLNVSFFVFGPLVG